LLWRISRSPFLAELVTKSASAFSGGFIEQNQPNISPNIELAATAIPRLHCRDSSIYSIPLSWKSTPEN